MYSTSIPESSPVGKEKPKDREEDVLQAMKHPLQMFGSDSIFGGKPHPRLYGTYPRVLGRYVRELQTLSLPQAIRQMTGAPAQLLRLKDRGLLREFTGVTAGRVIRAAGTGSACR